MKFTIHTDEDQTVVFEGDLIGHASNMRDESTLRWTEVNIYRTTAGTYVIEKVGASRVFHRIGSKCALKSHIDVEAHELYDDAIPCPKCVPVRFGIVLEEVDRTTVHVAEKAAGVITALHSTDDDGVRFITKTAKSALQEARGNDEAIDNAFTVRKIV